MLGAIVILVVYKALYVVGVSTTFTLSQAGMVVHWFRLKTPGWRWRPAMNGFGAFLTGIVIIVVLVTRFIHDAHIVLIAMARFYWVRRHCEKFARFLAFRNLGELQRFGEMAVSGPRTTVVLFLVWVNELTARSLALGRGLSPDDLHAVTIVNGPEGVKALRRSWVEIQIDVPSLVVDSPYGS